MKFLEVLLRITSTIRMADLSRDILDCTVDTSVDKALDILLENKEQLIIGKGPVRRYCWTRDNGGYNRDPTSEIVDESDQDAIDDGVLHEDMNVAWPKSERTRNQSKSDSPRKWIKT